MSLSIPSSQDTEMPMPAALPINACDDLVQVRSMRRLVRDPEEDANNIREYLQVLTKEEPNLRKTKEEPDLRNVITPPGNPKHEPQSFDDITKINGVLDF